MPAEAGAPLCYLERMCGICGRINREKEEPGRLRNSVEQMMRLIEHRGPDHGALWNDSRAALGYRRLSIIDLSPSGNQPVLSEDGRKVLVFNGEIYNFLEIKKQFASEIRFTSNSDTEVVLRLYEKFGVDCLRYLRGMFAFAIWDSEKEQLFFVRDRVGKKPLFYSLQNQKFIFASELRALLIHEDFRFEIDPESIYHYLSLQYIPSPSTIFKNVFKLPPAHFGLLKNGEVRLERYWQLNYEPQEWTEQNALQLFEQLFREAVSLRLISDVPLGAFLSGGIDSTAVVSMMAAVAGDRVKTFNISFEEEEFNEAPFARAASEKFGTQHQELTVKTDHTEIIPKLVWHYSEPFADSSAIPLYYLSLMTRQFVTVALSGDGGDELFGGYPRYVLPQTSAMSKDSVSSMISNAISKIPMNMRVIWRLRKFLEEKFLNLPRIYFQKICYFNEQEKQNLLTPSFQERTRELSTLDWLTRQMRQFQGVPFPQNLMALDTETYLPDDLLVKADIASMACSLEVRSPFLDQQLMEFAASLPASLKIQKGITKYLLKSYLRSKMPNDFIDRPKTGFGVPLRMWFRKELRSMTEDILLSRAAIDRGYFKRTTVEKIIQRHCSGLFDHTYQLYALLVLELWHEIFVDRRASSLALHRTGML